jgi:hypothetical protein
MTISEQLREAALYCQSPYWHMPTDLYTECNKFTGIDEWLADIDAPQLRTFMLLVAEALE